MNNNTSTCIFGSYYFVVDSLLNNIIFVNFIYDYLSVL